MSSQPRPPLLLKSLDEKLLLKTMMKMVPESLCRLRRTCSQMNSFIAGKNRELSTRILDWYSVTPLIMGLCGGCPIDMGISLEFEVDRFSKLVILVRNNHNVAVYKKAEELPKLLEGIPINRVHVLCAGVYVGNWNNPPEVYDDPVVLRQIEDILKNLRPFSSSLHLGDIPAGWILRISEVVNVKYISLARHNGDARLYLDVLRKAPIPKIFSPSFSAVEIKSEWVKCFDEVQVEEYQTGWFHRFLWDMYNSEDPEFNLERLHFSFAINQNPFANSPTFPPPGITLWENRNHPSSSTQSIYYPTESIRIIYLKSKCAVIYTNKYLTYWPSLSGDNYQKVVDITFAEKNPSAIFDDILRHFYLKEVEPSVRQEFISGNDERRSEIIEELYVRSGQNQEDRQRLISDFPNIQDRHLIERILRNRDANACW